jgi:hypothetical protein
VQLLTGNLTGDEPELSAQAKQMKDRARHLAQVLRLPFTEELETAAELGRLGLAGVPKHVHEKLAAHDKLAQAEMERMARIPEVLARVVDHIPHMAGVAEVIRYDGSTPASNAAAGAAAPRTGLKREDMPLASRILRAVLDLQLLEESGLTTAAAILRMRQDAGRYDRHVLKAVEALFSDPNVLAQGQLEQCMVETLVSGMVLATDALSTEGVSLVAAGTALTPGLIEHLRNFAELGELVQPVNVLRRTVPEAEAAPEAPPPPAPPPAAS